MEYKNIRRGDKKSNTEKLFPIILKGLIIIAIIVFIIVLVVVTEQKEAEKEARKVEELKNSIINTFDEYRNNEIFYFEVASRFKELDKTFVYNSKYEDEFYALLLQEIKKMDFSEICDVIDIIDNNLISIHTTDIIDDILNKFEASDIKTLSELDFGNLDEAGIKNPTLKSRLQERVNDSNLTVLEKLELGRRFDDRYYCYYSPEIIISKDELKRCVEEYGEPIYSEQGKGGYYDGRKDSFEKTSVLEYDYIKKRYFGDFYIEEKSEEYLDKYYQRKQRITLTLYFRNQELKGVDPTVTASYQYINGFLIKNGTLVYWVYGNGYSIGSIRIK